MVIGIVCEFDPLHRGHARLLSRARALGADTVVCAMSGSFTQRGSFAALSKTARAEMAVRCGADLVLELPTPWAMSPAETFARGGVRLLALAGADILLFGSECGDLPALRCLADCLDSPTFADHLTAAPESGLTFAARRQAAAASLLDNATAALLQSPNNTLAVEYLKAIRRRGLTADAVTVRREDGGHHGTASASHIRALLAAGQEAKAFALMPPQAADILGREMKKGLAPVDPARLERAMLARLRLMNEHDFASYDSGGEGLYRRVYRAVQEGGSLGDILTRATTKRYPTARVRRMLWAVFLGLEAPGEDIPYVRILAATEAGRKLLRQMQDAGVPVLTKAADVGRLGPSAEALFTREARRTDVYALACPGSPLPCGSDWRRTPMMI